MRSKETRRRVLEEAKLAYKALMKCYPLTLEDLEGEKWKDIAGYEGDYQESTYGRTKSFKRGKVKILKPFLQGEYLYVELHKGDQGKTIQVNRLVAETFIPNTDNLPEVNHRDGKKYNNHVSNLEWVTHAQNMRHAVDTGLQVIIQGEDHKKAALTNKDAVYIRENPDGLTGKELAEMFGVPPMVVSNIQTGKTYKNAGGEIREKKWTRTPTRFAPKSALNTEKGFMVAA